MKNFVSDYLKNLNRYLSNKNIEQIYEFCEIVEHSIKNKHNIYICGNGGSAANSIHMATDLNLVLIKKKNIIYLLIHLHQIRVLYLVLLMILVMKKYFQNKLNLEEKKMIY